MNPSEGGRGPATPIWMWSKRRLGIRKDCKGAPMCCWTTNVWHGMQALTQNPTCLLRPCHTNFEAMSLLEVRIEGRPVTRGVRWVRTNPPLSRECCGELAAKYIVSARARVVHSVTRTLMYSDYTSLSTRPIHLVLYTQTTYGL